MLTETPSSRSLTDAQRFDWLRLSRCDNVGPRTFRHLINRFGSAGAALAAFPDLARRGGGRPLRLAETSEIEREFEAAAQARARFVALGEPDYPALLREVDSAPPLVALRGDAALLSRPAVAIVGARNASAAGLVMTERVARGVAQAGYVVVSGLARGIDARAHQASLATGTIAVLPGGLDKVYPPEHAGLLEQIAERGVVMSEMPFGWEARGRDFPRRNRIVSGLAQGTVVIEAARRSGSLITAKFAAEQGREVFAVPGSPLDQRAEGTNDLLQDGATFCTGPDSVIDALADQIGGRRPRHDLLRESDAPSEPDTPLWDEWDDAGLAPVPTISAAEASVTPPSPATKVRKSVAADLQDEVLGLLGPTPVSLDDLVRTIGASVQEVRSILLECELRGLVQIQGNLVTRVVR